MIVLIDSSVASDRVSTFSYTYPGHPITLAAFILTKYEDIDHALARESGHEYPRALEDSDIPGSGSCVWAALDLLDNMRKCSLSLEETWRLASDYWDRSDSREKEQGSSEAERVWPLLKELVAKRKLLTL